MARKLRVEYAGAIYHVMNRGDRRELIFMDDADRQRFVETLGEETGSGNGRNGVREQFPSFGCMAGFNADRWVAVRRNGAATGDDAPKSTAFGGSGA
jgi:hypothetical protein